MNAHRVAVVGGGAAGFFAAIACAEAAPGAAVAILEKSPRVLAKVRVSGGGRCNLTHACFDPLELSRHYPRGAQALIGAFHRFQPSDTVAWFASRGLRLKREADGRMFPITDSSQSVIDVLVHAARAAGVQVRTDRGVERAAKLAGGEFELSLAGGETVRCDRLLLATGGCRVPAMGQIAVSLGHAVESPVPSLFAFHVAAAWLRDLPGLAVDEAQAMVPDTRLRSCGPLLVTHSGLSGPAILRLSAWGARLLAERNYHFPLHIHWLPRLDAAGVSAALNARRQAQGARRVVNAPVPPIPARLWERLALASGVGGETRWSDLTRAAQSRLAAQLARTELAVTGKSLNQEEFVTCGGVRLGEVNFKTMESRVCPGLHFAGELLDLDGLTGGFNFQAAWTTGWIAGRAMAGAAGAGFGK